MAVNPFGAVIIGNRGNIEGDGKEISKLINSCPNGALPLNI